MFQTLRTPLWLAATSVTLAACAAPVTPAVPPAGPVSRGRDPGPAATPLVPSAPAVRTSPLPVASASPPPPGRALDSPIRPLPGGLDEVAVFNSNNPELLRESGVLLSTFAGGGVHLNHPFAGAFEVFLHHLAETAFMDGNDTCWLGLLARNDGQRPSNLELKAGVSWLTGPDAPFIDLDPLVSDPRGEVYSGPGDRVALDFLLGRSNLTRETFALAAGETKLLFNQPIPAKNFGLPSRNGRSGLFRFQVDQPIKLAAVALFGRASDKPDRQAFQALLDAGKRAAPAERAATAYEPGQPPTGGSFIYGRVGGVSLGSRWTGTLFNRASEVLSSAGSSVGFPIASLALNTLGSRQNQSPRMVVRYPESPPEAHGSYGVTYDLTIPLDNPEGTSRRYAIALSHPLRIPENQAGAPSYAPTPGKLVTFRGSLQLDWDDERQQPRRTQVHLVLRQGERGTPFETVTVAPGGRTDARLRLVYPADCTPPQLLTVTRL
ncbi:MAG: DUF3370 family protein [Candidatus Sericytochromatia bacterium]|nr:DUF3370 family protein [Candidatus Sericytochromatia bacterium]